MKRRTTAYASIAILLAIVVLVTGCNPSASKQQSAETRIMRAMAQAIDDPAAKVSSSGKSTIRSFKADDGSVISGTIEKDENGNVIAAELTLTYPDGTLGPTLVLASDNGKQTAVLDNKPISTASLPKPMSREQRIAFALFLEGFEEAFDDIKDLFEDALEYYEDKWPDDYTLNYEGKNGAVIKGTVTVGIEEWGDDDTEVIAANITEFRFPLWFGEGELSGSYRFSERGDNEKAEIHFSIKDFGNDKSIRIDNARIDATIEEGEKFDDDYFSFNGNISGDFTINNSNHSISFNGSIEAVEDHYFRFPSYALTIDGENIAIGRQERPVITN